MPTSRDPYIVLGIPRNADPCEVKRAYRRLVFAMHPDITGDTSRAHELLEVQSAYQALADAATSGNVSVAVRSPESRAQDTPVVPAEPLRDADAPSPLSYSAWRHGLRFRPEPFATPEAEHLSRRARQVFSLVDELFQGFVPEVLPNRPRSEPKDLFVELMLTRDEARTGGTYPLTVPVQKQCKACLGSGLGDSLNDTCVRCAGKGYELQKREFEVVVPPGVTDGLETSLPVESDAGTITLRVAVKVV